MAQTSDELISSYLSRLHAACWPLGEARTSELAEGIDEHIQDAVAELGNDPATVAEILDRLGPPERIAHEASEQPPAPAEAVLLEKPSLTHEIWTIALLSIGGFVIPFIAWIAGVVLLLNGKRWLWWEKLLGILIVPGGPLGGIILLSIGQVTGHTTVRSCVLTGTDTTCTTSGQSHVWTGLYVLLLGIVFLGPIATGAFLWFRAKGRAALEQPHLVSLSYASPR